MKAMKSNFVTAAIATTTTLAISALSCLSISGFSQPAFGQNCSNPAKFYKGRDLRGASFPLCFTKSKTIPANFNDQISSLEIPRGRKCILYTDAGFKGRRIEFIGATNVVNLQPEFNNKVSSIQCTTS